jgi:hypothetical protein
VTELFLLFIIPILSLPAKAQETRERTRIGATELTGNGYVRVPIDWPSVVKWVRVGDDPGSGHSEKNTTVTD